jgi:hypothetical protein
MPEGENAVSHGARVFNRRRDDHLPVIFIGMQTIPRSLVNCK